MGLTDCQGSGLDLLLFVRHFFYNREGVVLSFANAQKFIKVSHQDSERFPMISTHHCIAIKNRQNHSLVFIKEKKEITF